MGCPSSLLAANVELSGLDVLCTDGLCLFCTNLTRVLYAKVGVADLAVK